MAISDINIQNSFLDSYVFHSSFSISNNSNYVHTMTWYMFDWFCTQWKFSSFMRSKFYFSYNRLVHLRILLSSMYKVQVSILNTAATEKWNHAKSANKWTVFHTNICHNPVYALLQVCKGQLFAVFGQFCFEQNFTLKQNSQLSIYLSLWEVHMQLVRTHHKYVMNSINTLWSLTL